MRKQKKSEGACRQGYGTRVDIKKVREKQRKIIWKCIIYLWTDMESVVGSGGASLYAYKCCRREIISGIWCLHFRLCSVSFFAAKKEFQCLSESGDEQPQGRDSSDDNVQRMMCNLNSRIYDVIDDVVIEFERAWVKWRRTNPSFIFHVDRPTRTGLKSITISYLYLARDSRVDIILLFHHCVS